MFKNALPFYILLLIVVVCAAIFLTTSVEGFETSAKAFLNKYMDKKIVVLLYDDNCGYCNGLKPEWEKAFTQASEKMIAVNCSDKDNPDVNSVIEKTNTQKTNFPRIFYLNGPKMLDYTGGPTKDEILKFVNANVK